MENGKNRSSRKRSRALEELKGYFESGEYSNDSDSEIEEKPIEKSIKEVKILTQYTLKI